MTKKQQAEINRSRRDFDKNHSIDQLHVLAIAEEADEAHDEWLCKVRHFVRKAEAYESNVRDFAAELISDLENGTGAAHTFSWGDSSATSAARASVLRSFIHVLEHRGPDVAYDVAQREALRGARNPKRSTSVLSNFVETETTAAWAEITEDWRLR